MRHSERTHRKQTREEKDEENGNKIRTKREKMLTLNTVPSRENLYENEEYGRKNQRERDHRKWQSQRNQCKWGNDAKTKMCVVRQSFCLANKISWLCRNLVQLVKEFVAHQHSVLIELIFYKSVGRECGGWTIARHVTFLGHVICFSYYCQFFFLLSFLLLIKWSAMDT